MKADWIEVLPFEKMTVIDCHGIFALSQHGTVDLVGEIPIEYLDEAQRTAVTTKSVKITGVESGGGRQILLDGVLAAYEISVEGHVAMIKLKVMTGTCQMDRKKHIRTFQNSNLTYDQVITVCTDSYPNNDVIMTSGKGIKISEFVVQYQETDWEFLNRLATYLGTVLVPDTRTGGVKYYFGLPRSIEHSITETVSYRMCRDLDEYERKRLLGVSLSEQDCDCYVITSREIYEIASRVNFMNRELTVCSIKMDMHGSELRHTYYLTPARGLVEPRRYQESVIGVSLIAAVTSVRDDMVKVTIKKDENRGKTGELWFPFATVYSSPDGTGWYCMPETGDTVRLCFPSECVKDAYVSSAVHEYSSERTNPEMKIWKNRQGKEIRLEPGLILLTNNEGTSIELSDKDGILMESAGSITFEAQGRVSITSQEEDIVFTGNDRIRLKQRDAAINLSDDLTFEGMSVKLH